jgi:prepilin signal peptidase PulO-like enzyme (type II secretory pathway)
MGERVLASLAAALVGAALGWLSAWATDWLQKKDDLPSAACGLLLRDPLVQGAAALAWAAAAWFLDHDWWRWVGTGVLSLPLIQVAITDLRHRYVYTLVAGVGLALGLAFGWRVHNADWWTSLLGAAGGALAVLVLYLLGRVLYRGGEPLARGDITIAGMVGAAAASCMVRALVLGVLLSGVFALGLLLARRSRRDYLPYGPGLCLGGLITLFWC